MCGPLSPEIKLQEEERAEQMKFHLGGGGGTGISHVIEHVLSPEFYVFAFILEPHWVVLRD